ncbi:hypothetical protein GCM10009765_82030 [Fodinicola feengrottensis]|uniref:Uncharacterized protein n=2 Tax=Fodinicola feengrottensis TaxID=435914 RepID=A0ABN2JAP3_9ACTN
MPRRDTIDRIVVALGLTGDQRGTFLAAWGQHGERRTVPFGELLQSPENYQSLLGNLDGRIDRVATTFAKKTTFVDPFRRIVLDRSERVVIASQSAVAGTPLVVAADSPDDLDAIRLYAVRGCQVSQQASFRDGPIGVFEIGFDRIVRSGEAYLYGFEHRYDFTSRHHVHGNRSSAAPFAGRNTMTGFHRAARLGITRVIFPPGDRPRRCVHLFERRLGGGYEEIDDLHVSDSGETQIVVVDPVAGWHGIGWEW